MSDIKERCSGRFNYENDCGVDCSRDKVRTQQHFKDEADVNVIMRKYAKTGILVDPSQVRSRVPQFGDFTQVDFHSMQNAIAAAKAAFMLLPSDVRSKFDNDPALAIEFAANPENNAEAVKLGLLDKSCLIVNNNVDNGNASVSGDQGTGDGVANLSTGDGQGS